jgi:hypothetical protein
MMTGLRLNRDCWYRGLRLRGLGINSTRAVEAIIDIAVSDLMESSLQALKLLSKVIEYFDVPNDLDRAMR